MKRYRVLNIKGAVLEKQQLEKYLEKIASDHVLTKKSDKDTYPIIRLKDNFEVIAEVYQLLNEHMKLKIPIHPAGEWLLDNFYSIEETVKAIEKELTLKKYINLLGIANGPYTGFARIYILASEIISYTDGKIEAKNLTGYLKAYQNKKTLSMEEIWNLGLFLQIAIIENIRGICENIYYSQIQKYKVENIIERLVENKKREELQFKNIGQYKERMNDSGDMKYPFIEYMSYRLRKFGKKAYQFLNVLEEEVNKMGTDISEVIQKEHFDMATKKVSMGNCITSIKLLQRLNFIEIFEEINKVDDILKMDPAGIYQKMDYKTKIYYRNKIEEISKKTKISEIYIAKKCLELAEGKQNKDAHVGYYLISEGNKKLIESLINKPIFRLNDKQKMIAYICAKKIISLLITALVSMHMYSQNNSLLLNILLAILIYIPIEEIVIKIIQYILGKIVKPKLIPKMDMSGGIKREDATFVVIPTILNNKQKVEELMNKLEVYYLANKSDNIYFALLGDCSSSNKQKEMFDNEIIDAGICLAEKLNEKYKDTTFPKFHFIYRKREWNEKEQCYLGWERKRGLLTKFNEYILGNSKNTFLENTIERIKSDNKEIEIPKIKYIITLDADTELVLNSGLELVGAMTHILNIPVLNNDKNLVIEGYGIMQPQIGINLEAARKTLFTKINSGTSGTDSYTSAASDIYQDNFNEGIFTGKGIYNLEIFSMVLKNQIPENTVLSHDLLEGSYLRCGLVSDIQLMDGYPTNYQSFKNRLSRWIRGDWQIIRWLKKHIRNSKNELMENPLNIISKYKILDNLVRSLIEPTILICFIYLLILNASLNIKIGMILSVLIISLIIPMLIEILDRIIFRKDGQKHQKTFDRQIVGIKGSIYKALIEIAILPDKAYMSLKAICKTVYRICISKKHLLEWMTAEEAEKKVTNTVSAYYKNMIPNIVLGIVTLIFSLIYIERTISIFTFIISMIYLIAPGVMYLISKKEKKRTSLEKLNEEEREYILEVAERTWRFFKDNLNEKSNFLPPDNYQEDRNPKVVYRTSPTNIGLALLSVVSSYDLGFESIENTIILLQKMLNTIERLNKWNGHLYNWYNIENLEPLNPKYVSTVDSGNFIGYLYVLKQFLEKIVEDVEKDTKKEKKTVINKEQIKIMIQSIQKLIDDTRFEYLYVEENKIFSIGFNVDENLLTPSYYDLLASEARQASFIAIAKKDIPSKHWYSLSRVLTVLNKYKGLISWSGTAFEYLMPTINIPNLEGSLLDETIKFAIMSQKEYSNKLNIPWGISESAFNLRDLNNNYQYKAFGIPWLGIKRGLADEIVVSSYGSILAINEDAKGVINNLKKLEKNKMYDKYGFYEAIDYTPNRLTKNHEYEVVKTYMAHHQGLILLSINNLFNNQILQKRFMDNPEIKAVDILLQERMPENVIITKEKKEKVEKIKNIDYEGYSVREYSKINEEINHINVISNNHYTVVMDEQGRGYSKFGNILINRYKETDEEEQGIFFFLRNIKTKKIWTSNKMRYLSKADKYNITFSPDMNKITRQDGNIETTTKVFIMPNSPVEIRRIELRNNGLNEENIEITSMLEPILSTANQDYAHKAFNNLFISYEFLEDTNTLLLKRNKRGIEEKNIYMAINLYTEDETVGEMEYEIDKEKFIGRGNIDLPKAIEKGIPLGRKLGMTTDPIVAIRKVVKIMPNESSKLNLIISVSDNKEEAIKNVVDNMNNEKIERNMKLVKAKVEAENMYLGVKGKEIDVYQQMLRYLVFRNPLKMLMYGHELPENAHISELWKYGISGDLPILLVKIKDVNDIDVVKDSIKAYEYFRIKNIHIDLVIINEEKKNYDNYIYEEIQNSILDKGLSYLQNIKGGIFVLNHIEKDSLKILEYKSNLLINSSKGSIGRQLKDYEEEYEEKNKTIIKKQSENVYGEQERIRESLKDKNLKYYNEYGGFSEDGKEYLIRVNKDERTPTVWSNIMANEKFGTVVTENMGGYTWYKNSRLNRLTAWNNNQVTDVPSESIILKDIKNQKEWSIGLSPIPDDNDYYITYGFGYTKYQHIADGIVQQLDMYVPRRDSIKVQILHLENIQTQKKQLKLFYRIKPVLGEDEIKSNGYIKAEKYANGNLVTLKNTISEEKDNQMKTILYISSNEQIKEYSDYNNIVQVEIEITLEALENKDIILVLGAEENLLECKDKAYQYTNINNAISEYEKEKRYWESLVSSLQVNTPVESTNIMLNGWLVYQTICSRIYARSGYYQSGGAYGFRDQLQDCIGIKYIAPEIVRKQIIKHSSHQFLEGDVQHWWHEENKRGIRTRFSDDLLWLPYLVSEYIEFTGDYSILEEATPYLKGEILPEGIDERYDIYFQSEIEENIYEHCKRAIEKSLSFGENGIPKIGSGDWNDGFSTVGNKGKGESIWLGFFMYKVLSRFIKLCEYKKEDELVGKYKKIMEELKKALNTIGWDGRWYRRAFTDGGEILGSIQNEECRIDSIAQSWATISDAGDNDKKYISMESLENHLLDRENGIIKLLDPPFEKSKLEPGYIKAYLPGTRENGGQYTHAAVWAIIAETILGFGDKASEFFRIINPIEHARTKEEAYKYKAEPYVIAADVYGTGNLAGRGGWTWYTGSSSWFYEAGIRYILGLKIEKGVLSLEPCIPGNWPEYSIRYRYGESIYHIKVTNKSKKSTGIERIYLNGEEVENKKIKLVNTGGIYNIDAEI